MKNIIINVRYKLPILFFSFLISIYTYAQDSSNTTVSHSSASQSSSSSTTIPENTAMWYSSPWVWVVGALLLIVILLTIFRGGSGSKSEVSHTVKSTTEVKND
jgi:hypothetical protein